jgi:hypothetical protein
VLDDHVKDRKALFTGRFQPPSIAHVATALAILERWEFLVIGVADPNLGARRDLRDLWSVHIDATKDGFSPARYLFESREVVRMWTAWINATGLAHRIRCEAVPRPSFVEFSLMFPPEDYDFVVPGVQAKSTPAELLRKALFPKLLGREVFEISPSFVLHNSEIRTFVLEGRSWSEFLAPAVYDVFTEIGGAARIAATEKPPP